jgi:hypothetical protein
MEDAHILLFLTKKKKLNILSKSRQKTNYYKANNYSSNLEICAPPANKLFKVNLERTFFFRQSVESTFYSC